MTIERCQISRATGVTATVTEQVLSIPVIAVTVDLSNEDPIVSRCVFILQFTVRSSEAVNDYVQIYLPHMPGQERLKDRLPGRFTPSPSRPITPNLDPQASSPVGFKHFLHSFVPGRSRAPSPDLPITPTLDHPQASSTPVGFKHFFHSLVPSRSRAPSPSPARPISPTLDSQVSSTPVGPDSDPIHGIPDTQPLNSPSNIYPSIVIEPAGDKAPGGKADLASTVFQGVKTTLRLVERAADAFPPLKSTVAGLLGVIDIAEVRDFQLSVVIVMVLTVPRQSLRTNKIAKIWHRSWKPLSQLSIIMPHGLLSLHVSRVSRRRVLSTLSW